jgi:2-phospho-L-lactate/phosphoenolpyruvate guanylyltransferase
VPLLPLHVVVPVRSLSDGKRRLGSAVDAEERETLVVGLLRSTLAASEPLAPVIVVSADPAVLAIAQRLGATTVAEQTHDDLNAALRLGRAAVTARGAQSVLFLPADLPLLTIGARTLDELAAAPAI